MIEWLDLPTGAGHAWFIRVGEWLLAAADPVPNDQFLGPQPTLAQAKAYIAAHESDERLVEIIHWAIHQRERLAAAATAAGRDPATINRITKFDTLIAHLGDMI